MISQIEDYFTKGCGRCERFATADCSTHHWAEGLARLRALCRAAGLDEQVKWGHPCYAHAGRNVAIIGAVRAGFRLGFFNAALMKDPHGVLEKQGPNTPHPDSLRFTSVARVDELEDVILSYLAEAAAHARAGTVPAKVAAPVELPAELAEALSRDGELAAAFERLTPGRRRSYVVALSTAKTSATRVGRIAKFRPGILAGKGAQER